MTGLETAGRVALLVIALVGQSGTFDVLSIRAQTTAARQSVRQASSREARVGDAEKPGGGDSGVHGDARTDADSARRRHGQFGVNAGVLRPDGQPSIAPDCTATTSLYYGFDLIRRRRFRSCPEPRRVKTAAPCASRRGAIGPRAGWRGGRDRSSGDRFRGTARRKLTLTDRTIERRTASLHDAADRSRTSAPQASLSLTVVDEKPIA